MRNRRSFLLDSLTATAALSSATLLAGCPLLPDTSALKESLRVGYSAGSHVHAFQSWSFVYAFAMGNATELVRAAERLRRDGVPLLKRLVTAGALPRLAPSTYPGGQGIQAYAIDLVVTPKKGKAIRVPGKQGTSEAAWHGAAAAVSAATGVPAAEVEAGQGAWYGLTRVLTGLDAEAATLTKHAFALTVLQQQVQAGQAADWFDPTRPAEETLADTNHALSLIDDDIRRVRAEQAAILALLALANHAERPGLPEALDGEIAAAGAAAAEWLSTHRQPTPADFGVVYQVPDPKKVQEAIEEQLGVVGAAVNVARGVATGDLPRTLDGLAGLAPKDTKVRTIAEGVAAASKGDIRGTLHSIAELGGPDTSVGAVAARLERIAGALKLVR